MTTVIDARDLGRGVGAVPGPLTSVASAGPNVLIKQGFASLVTQPSDVIDLLDADPSPGRAMTRPEIGREFGHRRPSRSTPGRSL